MKYHNGDSFTGNLSTCYPPNLLGGEYFYKNGDYYEGYMRDQKPEGEGVFTKN